MQRISKFCKEQKELNLPFPDNPQCYTNKAYKEEPLKVVNAVTPERKAGYKNFSKTKKIEIMSSPELAKYRLPVSHKLYHSFSKKSKEVVDFLTTLVEENSEILPNIDVAHQLVKNWISSERFKILRGDKKVQDTHFGNLIKVINRVNDMDDETPDVEAENNSQFEFDNEVVRRENSDFLENVDSSRKLNFGNGVDIREDVENESDGVESDSDDNEMSDEGDELNLRKRSRCDSGNTEVEPTEPVVKKRKLDIDENM